MDFSEQLRLLLLANYTNPHFDYAQLCELLGWSRSKVYRKFQEEHLGSPSTYIRNFRLEKAKELLVDSNLSMLEIAHQIGFNSPAHFSDTFAKVFEMAPTKYRIQVNREEKLE